VHSDIARATVSVLIPAYNASKTIRATLESVLNQTVQPDEILVMDDGSTDDTARIVSSFGAKVTLFRQANRGLSGARNALIAKARSSLIAFLDSDDLLHPRYLEAQLKAASLYPSAIAYFAEHLTFIDGGEVHWEDVSASIDLSLELIQPTDFVKRYATTPGHFFIGLCCVPTRILKRFGEEPFRLRAAEDVYFTNRLAFEGPVVLCSAPLGAYRLREGSISWNRVMLDGFEVQAFELLENDRPRLSRKSKINFDEAIAVKRRLYAKILMGIRRKSETRQQLLYSLRHSLHPSSLIKSMGLFCMTYAPARLHPKWPGAIRPTLDGPRPA